MTARPKRRHSREVSIPCGWQLGEGVTVLTAHDMGALLYICRYMSYGIDLYCISAQGSGHCCRGDVMPADDERFHEFNILPHGLAAICIPGVLGRRKEYEELEPAT